MDPNDIPDLDVREWYKKEINLDNEKIMYVSVEELSSEHFNNSYITGYYCFITDGHLNENNPYWQYVLSLRNSITTQSGYNILSMDECRKKTIDRFKVIESILQDGYDVTKPIVLWTLKFKKNTSSITSREGQVLEFNGYDGHHRIASAKEIGLKYIPAKMGSPNFMPITSLEKMSKREKWKWYQPIDFKTKTKIVFDHKTSNLHGAEKYNFILREALYPIKEHKFIDLGCNTGVITACIAADGAERIIGIDYSQKIKQAGWVKRTLWADYGNLLFRGINLRDDLDKLQPILELQVDCILMSNFIYYMGDKADELIDMCSNYANRIVLQGNALKKDPKQPHYRGEYSQIQGMKELLKRHGYHHHRTIAPHAYHKPVVVGEKTQKNRSYSITQNAKPFEKTICDLARSSPYWDIAKRRFITSVKHLASFVTQSENSK